ncbi:hypothetical protein Scep_027715 [Stephania cephalantha]|uniref:Uncharacterized protein n=1 Tax=Stephania cephalantha TaxID=152367 RepID=A0AAP0HHH3_9MAGN
MEHIGAFLQIFLIMIQKLFKLIQVHSKLVPTIFTPQILVKKTHLHHLKHLATEEIESLEIHDLKYLKTRNS